MTRRARWWLVLAGVAVLVAGIGFGLSGRPDPAERLEAQARRYVTLALSLRTISPDDVDDYFGPAELMPSAPLPPDVLQVELAALADALRADEARASMARRARLLARVEHLQALLGVIEVPRSLDLDAQGRAIFGVTPLPVDRAAMAAARAELEALLPGEGELSARLTVFRARYVMPRETGKAVFMRALAECRRRTLAVWDLPADEALEVEWDNRIPAAWHHYLGGHRSRLQVYPGATLDPASALDMACHEAYPGHHAQFLLMDARADGLPVEETLVLLRSPQSALREGAANFGVSLVFPAAAREAFMRDELFPMAGFAPDEAARYEAVHRLAGQFSSAVVPILKGYRAGRLTRNAAAQALGREALVSSPEALIAFFDRYGALVLGYTVAEARVRAAVMAADDRWARLADIVSGLELAVLRGEDGRPPDARAGR